MKTILGYRWNGMKTMLALLVFFTVNSSWAKPPYQVMGYCYTSTMASSSSLTGSGGNINWSTNVPWNDLTVAEDAFMIPNTNNTFSNGGAKNSTLVSAAHANGTRCVVSIGGGGQDGAFPTLCEASNREAFASAVTAMMAQYGYDGAEIDWETPNAAAQSDATAMMQDLYNDIKAMSNSSVDGQPRTLSFTTVDYIDQIYDMTTLANYTDWCFFMGYDWYDCPSLANGPLNSIQSEIESLTNGSLWSYPVNKMVLGCPLYVNDYNTSACTANEYNVLSILHLGTPGAYDSAWAEQAYTAPNGDTVYVDTAQSFCDKTNWAIGYGCKGIGMWDVGMALPYTDSAVSGIWNTIGGQSSCLTVVGPTATPTKTATPVVASTWRVNAGGSAYTDASGNVWAADENYSGGTAAVTTSTISNSSSSTLYDSQRYGNPFTYTFNVPAGNYQVSLLFAETYWSAAGQREFNVSINGSQVLTNFDIYATAGGQNKAVTETFSGISASGGTITLTFGPASVDNAEIQGIQIVPQATSPTATWTPTLTPTITLTPTETLTSTATNSPTMTFTATSSFTSTPTPSFTATTAPGQSVWRVVAGGPAHTDCNGNVWAADENFSGGTAATSTNTITGALPCSSDGALYQDQRYGTFTYTFPVSAGNYQVDLKFAETYFTAAGDREFNVAINGATELTNFDIYATAGGANKAIDEVFNNIAVTGSAITITFGPAAVNNAMIQAIQIIPQGSLTSTPTRTSTPTQTPTATWTPTFTQTATPTGQTTWRVVAGGPAHTDCNGNVWAADENFSGGTAATSTNTITGALPCSTDGALYQDQRYGTFTYTFPVPAGNYQVDLKFAETYWTAAGDREFNVAINGTTELTNFDIFASAGGQNKAIDKVYNNITTSGGAITITFGPASVNYAMISSIQIIPQPATTTPTNTPTMTNTLVPTNTATVSNTPTSTNTPTVTNTQTSTNTPLNTSTTTNTATVSNTQTSTNTMTVTNSATQTPTRTWTTTFTSTPAGQTVFRVNAGGPAFTDNQGNVWAADEDYSGGTAASPSTVTVTGTSNSTLYQTQRYGSPFTYSFPVSAGTYQVTLKFAETYWTAAGDRVFNVSINGTQVLTNFDIFATAGGANIALDKVFNSISAANGAITLTFGPATVDNAVIQAIQIIPQSSAALTPSPTATSTTAATPNFGPNVYIFKPSMSSSSIQTTINNIYSTQYSNQFGSARYAFLFMPGTYNNSVSIGYYTQALGLGSSPNAVTINGGVISSAALANGNATCNFWEGAENMAVVPTGGTNKWAVSQACPMRRMHIEGNLVLADTGSQNWSSGGFLGDSLIDGQVNSSSQQQFLSRNDSWGSWTGSNWNMVFVGDPSAPSSASWPSPPDTVINSTPLVREKPFLQVDNSGNFYVFVPALRSSASGTSWSSGTEAGTAIPISQFYIAQSATDTSATLNAALAAGKNLLLTPGVYSLTAPLQVNNANTVILGLGIATLLAENGTTAMQIADVDGVSVAGILFDAGPTSSPILLQVGPTGSSASHSTNPTLLADLFFRIGGAAVGKAVVSLQINSNNVIGDDFWIWRADHSNGVGWTVNTAQNGLVVNGNNVSIYGLACEHFQQYQTLWNGNGGSVYFYQSEEPYDVPQQSQWMNGTENGYASYKVADTVTSHTAYGLGIYNYFTSNTSINLTNAIEVPTSGLDGAMIHNMVTVGLAGGSYGSISSILDGYGTSTANTSAAQYLAY